MITNCTLQLLSMPTACSQHCRDDNFNNVSLPPRWRFWCPSRAVWACANPNRARRTRDFNAATINKDKAQNTECAMRQQVCSATVLAAIRWAQPEQSTSGECQESERETRTIHCTPSLQPSYKQNIRITADGRQGSQQTRRRAGIRQPTPLDRQPPLRPAPAGWRLQCFYDWQQLTTQVQHRRRHRQRRA